MNANKKLYCVPLVEIICLKTIYPMALAGVSDHTSGGGGGLPERRPPAF